MTHCQIKNACGLATLRPGLGNRTRLFMSLTPGLDTRSGDKTGQLHLFTLRAISCHRTAFILGLTDITTMPSIRSINLLTQILALAQQLQLLLVAVLLQSVLLQGNVLVSLLYRLIQ
jgi:hypothetical protein